MSIDSRKPWTTHDWSNWDYNNEAKNKFGHMCRLRVVVEPARRTLTFKIVRASPGVGGGVRIRVPEVTFPEVTFPEVTFPEVTFPEMTFPEMTVLHVFRK